MSINPIDKLECRLESLTEGAFARLFRRTISARDVALLLLRSIEDNAAAPTTNRGKPIAPDRFYIHVHPDIAKGFLAEHADLSLRLARLIIDLCQESGFQLASEPQVVLLTRKELTPLQAGISAEHSRQPPGETAPMQAVKTAPRPAPDIRNPMLHVGGEGVATLAKSIINIGRESGNDIVIADAYISRHHLQLRKSLGAFTLFDVNSRGGTRVNGNAVAEHRLQNGDVINIGHSTLVYSDENGASAIDDTTQLLQQG